MTIKRIQTQFILSIIFFLNSNSILAEINPLKLCNYGKTIESTYKISDLRKEETNSNIKDLSVEFANSRFNELKCLQELYLKEEKYRNLIKKSLLISFMEENEMLHLQSLFFYSLDGKNQLSPSDRIILENYLAEKKKYYEILQKKSMDFLGLESITNEKEEIKSIFISLTIANINFYRSISNSVFVILLNSLEKTNK
jgi:hypothetical protein